MMDSYVSEVVDAARKAGVKTREEWDALVIPDVMAGWHDEVDQARIDYFRELKIIEAYRTLEAGAKP